MATGCFYRDGKACELFTWNKLSDKPKEVLPECKLRKLSTKRLLNYKKKHFGKDSVAWKGEFYDESERDFDELYQEYKRLLISILNEREHVG